MTLDTIPRAGWEGRARNLEERTAAAVVLYILTARLGFPTGLLLRDGRVSYGWGPDRPIQLYYDDEDTLVLTVLCGRTLPVPDVPTYRRIQREVYAAIHRPVDVVIVEERS